MKTNRSAPPRSTTVETRTAYPQDGMPVGRRHDSACRPLSGSPAPTIALEWDGAVPGGACGVASDSELRALFMANFQAAFRSLRALALSIVRDAFCADDVLQDAAVIALGKLGRFQPGSNFHAWMGQIVRFVALNHARRNRRLRTASMDPEVLETLGPVEADSGGANLPIPLRGRLPADQAHFDDRVMRSLNMLNDTARTCLLLRTVDGLDYNEIASRLGIPANTAMSHVHRARQFLREHLERE